MRDGQDGTIENGRWMEGARAYENGVEKLTGGTLKDGMRMRSVEMTTVTA